MFFCAIVLTLVSFGVIAAAFTLNFRLLPFTSCCFPFFSGESLFAPVCFVSLVSGSICHGVSLHQHQMFGRPPVSMNITHRNSTSTLALNFFVLSFFHSFFLDSGLHFRALAGASWPAPSSFHPIKMFLSFFVHPPPVEFNGASAFAIVFC